MNKKEQILAKKIISRLIGDEYMPAEMVLSLNEVYKLMEDYHEAKMKEELTRFMLCLTIDKYQDNKDADIIKEYMDIYFGESVSNETK